jgi:hypothetical protein
MQDMHQMPEQAIGKQDFDYCASTLAGHAAPAVS